MSRATRQGDLTLLASREAMFTHECSSHAGLVRHNACTAANGGLGAQAAQLSRSACCSTSSRRTVMGPR